MQLVNLLLLFFSLRCPLCCPLENSFLVVGGCGRVGGSTAKWLHLLSEAEGNGPANLILGGRSRASFESAKERILQQLRTDNNGSSLSLPTVVSFSMDIDKDGLPALASVIKGQGVDVVGHTAGRFHQKNRPAVFEASAKSLQFSGRRRFLERGSSVIPLALTSACVNPRRCQAMSDAVCNTPGTYSIERCLDAVRRCESVFSPLLPLDEQSYLQVKRSVARVIFVSFLRSLVGFERCRGASSRGSTRRPKTNTKRALVVLCRQKARVSSYVILKNSLPPSLRAEQLQTFEYKKYFLPQAVSLVGTDLKAILKDLRPYRDIAAACVESVECLSSMVEFDALMSFESTGFPRFSLLLSTVSPYRIRFIQSSVEKLLLNLRQIEAFLVRVDSECFPELPPPTALPPLPKLEFDAPKPEEQPPGGAAGDLSDVIR